jgi:hypothetical protein
MDMEHQAILGHAAVILGERAAQYGKMNDTIERACDIFALITGSRITPYEANIFMHSLKLARIRPNPQKADNFIDGVNYLAFAGEYATAGQSPETIVDEGMREMVDILNQSEG